MALKNIFKRKKEKEKKEKTKKQEKTEPKTKEVKAPKKEKKKVSEIAYRVLIAPHITEKATNLTSQNQYVFKVFKKANKIEIKKAIEQIYGVDVLDVKIINIPRKPKRLGGIRGWKKGYKKAIVKIKKGQKIELT